MSTQVNEKAPAGPIERKTKQELQREAPPHPLEGEASRLLLEVESLASSFVSSMLMTQAVHTAAAAEWKEFLKQKGDAFVDKGSGQRLFRVSALDYEESRKLNAKHERAQRALQLVPRSFVVSLTSVFDVFLGRLVRTLFLARPALLRAIKRELTLEEIQGFEKVSQVEEFVLDQEIEGLIRESRRKQFAWLESKFGVTLSKDLACWPLFVELSERRNLFVHTDGAVSKQYLQTCNEVGYSWLDGEPKVNQVLEAPRQYFARACDTTIEIGLKLLWVLWRTQSREDLLVQDRNFINLTYQLIADDRSVVAAELLNFALTEKAWKFYDDDSRLRCLLNLAQAHKWSGADEKCEATLLRQEWTALTPVFRLGALVLQRRFAEAAAVLPQAVSVDGLTEATFVQWPIFREFRATDEFRTAFRAVFGRDYASVESSVDAASPEGAEGKVEHEKPTGAEKSKDEDRGPEEKAAKTKNG